MNWLNLCSGGETGRQAVKELGLPVTNWFSSEIDKFAIKVADDNHDDITHLGDIRTVIEKTKNLPIDVMLCGSPCQGFSFAGKQLKFDDPRSKLFFEFVRIKEETKPRWFLLENVKMKQDAQDIITKYMGVKPIEINSSLAKLNKYWDV